MRMLPKCRRGQPAAVVGDDGAGTTTRDRTGNGEPAYWLNGVIAALGAVVLIGGSTALLRWSDSLTLIYLFIGLGVVVFGIVGVLVKRRAEDRARTRGLG